MTKNFIKSPWKIDVAKERIKELETMINQWEGIESEGFGDTECSISQSSPGCLIFNESPSMDKSSRELKRIISNQTLI